MSGPRSAVGQRNSAAARLAVKEANDAGGVLGRQVELVVGDDACDAGTAVAAANALLAKDILVSVGGACSVASVPTLTIFRNAGVPMVIPSSNSTDLLDPGYDSVFLVTGTTAAEARFTLGQLRHLGVRRLSVVDDSTSYSTTLANATVALAGPPGSGLSVAGHLQLSQGASSYRRIADDIVHAAADGVFFTGYSAEAAQLILDLKAAGYTGAVVFGDGCVDDSTFAKLSAADSNGVYAVSFPIPQYSPGAAEWAARYAAANGSSPGPDTMQAYDAVKIALDAVRRAGSTDRGAVRAAIASTQDLLALTGPVRFEPDGSRADPRFLLLQARDNRYTLAPVA
jgi:branched-chain amino acid transport system substrate-binding protein